MTAHELSPRPFASPPLPKALRRARTLAARVLAGLALSLGVATPFLTDPAAAQPAPAAPAAPAVAMPANVDAAVACVQGFYDKSSTFKSKFTQVYTAKAYNTTKTSTGSVVFSKPGKMYWLYDSENACVGSGPGRRCNTVVSDGSIIKVYEAGNAQMFEQPVDKSQYPAALSFLTGTGKLADSFAFELFPGDKMNFPGGYVLVGQPKTPTAAYSKVLFYVDPPTCQILRAMVIDGQANRNRFDFQAPQVNLPVPPSQFTFTPPPGTSIVKP
jgi:outer membrane lipoprotein carrier protein